MRHVHHLGVVASYVIEKLLFGNNPEVARAGLVGEERAAKLLYLVLTTRLFEKPVSAVVKGPSSAGKSILSSSVLNFFPTDAYFSRTAMSERAIVYSEEPLQQEWKVR